MNFGQKTISKTGNTQDIHGSRYSRMDQIKFEAEYLDLYMTKINNMRKFNPSILLQFFSCGIIIIFIYIIRIHAVLWYGSILSSMIKLILCDDSIFLLVVFLEYFTNNCFYRVIGWLKIIARINWDNPVVWGNPLVIRVNNKEL